MEKLTCDKDVRIKIMRRKLECHRLLYEIQRHRQQVFQGEPFCSTCSIKLGRLWNTGAHCPGCGNKVCKNCRLTAHDHSQKFICKVCKMKWLIEKIAVKCGISCSPLPLVPPTYAATISSSNKTKHVGHTYGSVLFKTLLLNAMIEEASEECHHARITTESSVLSLSPTSSKSKITATVPAPSISHISAINASPCVKSSQLSECDSDQHIVCASNDIRTKKHDSQYPFESSMTAMAGRLFLGIQLANDSVSVHINRGQILAEANQQRSPNPYITVCLVTARTMSRKMSTEIKMETLNPLYMQTLKFHLENSDIALYSLWLCAWDWGRSGIDRFLGEVKIPLSNIGTEDNCGDSWYMLQNEAKIPAMQDPIVSSLENIKADSSLYGRVLLSVKYFNGRISIFINRAQGLVVAQQDKNTNPYMSVCLVSDMTRYHKKKTKIIKKTLNPVYRETFQFCVEHSWITQCTLLLCAWDWNRFGKDRFIGVIVLPMSNIDLKDVDGCWHNLEKEDVAVEWATPQRKLLQRLMKRKTSSALAEYQSATISNQSSENSEGTKC